MAAWRLASCAPGAAGPGDLGGLDWVDAAVPGTVASTVPGADVDARDWWYRARLDEPPATGGEELILRLDGLATFAEVYVDGELVLTSESMWEAHAVDLSARGAGEVAIRFAAMDPLLATPRKPRARWRPRLADGALRFHRTALFGRAPGFAPGPPIAGPWRPVRVERRRGPVCDALSLRPSLDGDDGVLHVRATLRGASGEVVLDGPSGRHAAPLSDDGTAVLRVPGVARWWPHTHGAPVLHDVAIRADGSEVARRRTGFRELTWRERPEEDGLALAVNGVPVFARGAVWTTADPVAYGSPPERLRPVLEDAREAGLNMLRLAGIGLYETPAFHDLCDELGLLVWQDFMFANFDYPIGDEGFRAAVEREATQVLDVVAGRPSLAVLCGNSEVEQQVTMLGLDPALARGELFDELLPALARRAGANVPYLPSAPCGGDLPISTDRGVANYFGVGGYRRPLSDARRADVKFASECLAFANVGEEAGVDGSWKAGVARDVGSGWDFDDVRDYYLGALYGVDAVALRASDPDRYLELGRAVTGEVMAEVFGEWRRAGSPCNGGIILWLRDLRPGAGWGVLDHRGRRKLCWHHLRRALAPIALWTLDEGMNGIRLHVANDRPEPLSARLRVALYRGGELLVDEAARDIEVPAHGLAEVAAESLLGRFADINYVYRFGPPGHDAVVATLHAGDVAIADSVRFPGGPPIDREPIGRLGLEARASAGPGGEVTVELVASRLAWGVRVAGEGYTPDDDGFFLEPGRARTVRLTPAAGATPGRFVVTALNGDGVVAVEGAR